MLRDITQKHDSSLHSTLLYVKAFLEWTLTHQDKYQSNTDYYTVFLLKIKMIKSHNGEPRFHDRICQKHLIKLLTKKNFYEDEKVIVKHANSFAKNKVGNGKKEPNYQSSDSINNEIQRQIARNKYLDSSYDNIDLV